MSLLRLRAVVTGHGTDVAGSEVLCKMYGRIVRPPHQHTRITKLSRELGLQLLVRTHIDSGPCPRHPPNRLTYECFAASCRRVKYHDLSSTIVASDDFVDRPDLLFAERVESLR